jgi:hypothetical protein
MKLKLFGMTMALPIAVISSAVIFGHPGPTRSNDAVQQEKAGAQEKAKAITIKGQVTGGSGSVLTVTDAKKTEYKLTLTADTKITKGGQPATLADLKMNDPVTIQATSGTDGTLTATSIDIGA